jgi:hypothetical protein
MRIVKIAAIERLGSGLQRSPGFDVVRLKATPAI